MRTSRKREPGNVPSVAIRRSLSFSSAAKTALRAAATLGVELLEGARGGYATSTVRAPGCRSRGRAARIRSPGARGRGDDEPSERHPQFSGIWRPVGASGACVRVRRPAQVRVDVDEPSTPHDRDEALDRRRSGEVGGQHRLWQRACDEYAARSRLTARDPEEAQRPEPRAERAGRHLGPTENGITSSGCSTGARRVSRARTSRRNARRGAPTASSASAAPQPLQRRIVAIGPCRRAPEQGSPARRSSREDRPRRAGSSTVTGERERHAAPPR